MTNSTRGSLGIVRAAAAVLALALVPAPSPAQTAPSRSRPAAAAPSYGPTLPYSLSIAIGPSFESPTAFKLRLEGSMVLRSFVPGTVFELALPASFTFWSQSVFGASADFFRFELVPTARLIAPMSRELGIYGDAGLGFHYFSVSTTFTGTPFPVTFGASGAGGVFKLAGGGYYAIDPHFRIFVEPVGLNFYFGEGNGFVYTIMFGGSYRF